ncbi:MAG TPA: 3-deoxy-7-phosphoheptulonate synthase class II [Kofleriaceae bacterium]|jgi:3-deoxy-7-phosphoheptulonate synthase
MERSDWSPSSWRTRPAQQQPTYPDEKALRAALTHLVRLPPLVTSGEVELLKEQFAEAAVGERFILQGGDCSERFEDCHTPIIFNKLKVLLQMSLILLDASQKKITRVARLAGQYAKPRSSLVETIDGLTLPAYQGDLVNRPEFTAEARTPDPANLLTGYQYAALTLNWIRGLVAGNYSHLEYPEYWNLDFAARSPHADAYKETLRRLTGSVRFMEACAGATMRQIMKFEVFTSHEALLLPFEEAFTHPAPYRTEVYNLGTHFPWIGNRTRALDGAHVEYMRGIGNPIGVKVDGSLSCEDAVQLARTLNPDNDLGKLVLVCRFGANKVRAGLPALINAIRGADLDVVWMCDPMHGNTVKTSNGLKTRSFDAILSEIRDSFAIHREQKTILGGIHFELTGEDVTECTGGARDLSERDLERAYKSLVDPRLNYEQALEMALQVGALMPKWVGHPPAGTRARTRY